VIMRGLTDIGFSSEEATALYGNYTTLAVPMFNLAIAIVSPISVAYMPMFTRAFSSGNKSLLKENVDASINMTAFLCAPIILGICVYSKEILSFLFGKMGVDIGSSLLLLLVPAIFFSSNLLILNSALEACGCANAPVFSMLAGSLAKFALSFILIRNPSFAIAGAPIGTSICYAVASIVSILLANKKVPCDIPIIKLSLKSYVLSFLAILPTRLIFELIVKHASMNIAFIVSVLICACLYLALSQVSGTLKNFKRLEMSKYTKSV